MANYVDVGMIGPDALRVTLLGPRSTDGRHFVKKYNEFTRWCDDVLLSWTVWCKTNRLAGNWSWSRDAKDDQWRLHVWFQNPGDACIFKLMTANYS